jgi:hypothetical protein
MRAVRLRITDFEGSTPSPSIRKPIQLSSANRGQAGRTWSRVLRRVISPEATAVPLADDLDFTAATRRLVVTGSFAAKLH